MISPTLSFSLSLPLPLSCSFSLFPPNNFLLWALLPTHTSFLMPAPFLRPSHPYLCLTSFLVPWCPFLHPHTVFLMTSCLLSHACFFFHLPYFSSALSLSHILSSPFFLALSLLCTCTFLHLCSHMIALVFCSLTFSNTRPLSWSCLSCAHAFLCVLAFLCSHALLLSTLPLLALTLSCVLMLALSHTSFLFFGEHSF